MAENKHARVMVTNGRPLGEITRIKINPLRQIAGQYSMVVEVEVLPRSRGVNVLVLEPPIDD